MASPPAIHSTPCRWPNRPDTGAMRYTSQIAEKNQRIELLPLPGTIPVPRALVTTPGRSGGASVVASLPVIAIACSPHIHAATFLGLTGPTPPGRTAAGTPRGSPRVPARPPMRWPGPYGHWSRGSDRLRGGSDRGGGQRGEDPQPDDQADGQADRHGDVLDHVGADLHRVIGGRELADLAQEAGQREPQAAEDGEDEVRHQADRLHLIRVVPVPDGHG